jgi:putative PIN family toxin of toxin-antitoxin system
MRVVVDTNCFLAIVPKVSPYRFVFDAYRTEQFELAVSSEILNEYVEIFAQKMTSEIAENILELILKQANTIETDIYYRWNLITIDPDDNKFVDCAIAAQADYLVTSDAHFNVLKFIPFPQVQVIGIAKFMDILKLM